MHTPTETHTHATRICIRATMFTYISRSVSLSFSFSHINKHTFHEQIQRDGP